MKYLVFKTQDWPSIKFNGRKKIFRGLSRASFKIAQDKHWNRLTKKFSSSKSKVQKFKETMDYFSTIPYIYEGDGMDDFNKFQRPCNNGIGYVAICPGEPANNYYVEDPHIVKCLKRKYEDWFRSHNTKF